MSGYHLYRLHCQPAKAERAAQDLTSKGWRVRHESDGEVDVKTYKRWMLDDIPGVLRVERLCDCPFNDAVRYGGDDLYSFPYEGRTVRIKGIPDRTFVIRDVSWPCERNEPNRQPMVFMEQDTTPPYAGGTRCWLSLVEFD